MKIARRTRIWKLQNNFRVPHRHKIKKKKLYWKANYPQHTGIMICDRITGHVPSINSNLKLFIKAVLNIYRPRSAGLPVRVLWLRKSHLNLIPTLLTDGIEVNAPFKSILNYANINNKLRPRGTTWLHSLYTQKRPSIKCIRIIICSSGSKFSFKTHFCWASKFLFPHHDIWQLITLDACRCHLWYSAKVSKLTW